MEIKKLEKMAKKDNKIMSLLKISEISHILATTNNGMLVLHLPFQGTGKDYRFVLDAVPVHKDKQKDLMNIFFDDEQTKE